MGFGDLNFPNVKVLSLTSEVIEFLVDVNLPVER